MSTREQLEQSLAGLEAQRAILGDAIVDPAIAGIKMQLDALSPPPEPQSQRKQITVLFADVSGFTAMSETMDAEDVQMTMNALWQRVDQCILDHNGRIDKHIGDAVMALWGVDGAREDDPEQAIRAALAMQTAVYEFAAQQNIPLKMRIGLNTGSVLLGEVGTTAEFTAMGDAVNIASRLEHAAPIGGILISQAVYQHVRGVFDVAPQEPLTVKGKTEPLQVYVVNRAKARAFRTGTRGVEGVETRMVGRDSELQALQTAWQESVTNSQTTLITVIGDAGVGKSRLLYEFENWLNLQPDAISLFRGRSAEQTQGTPYFLLRDLLATRFTIRESDPIANVRRKFEIGISEILSDEAEMKAHILGQWLGYDFGDSPHIAPLRDDAEQLKNRGLLYLTQFWAAMGDKRPLILLLEDIHWADTSSLDAILDILRREPTLPMLVIALTRPSLFEHRPAWRNLGESDGVQVGGLEFQEPDYRFLTLNPLPSAADRELLAEILKKVPDIPEKLFNLIADRAEGNPFYMEELVKMLIDGGVILPDDDVWQVNLSQLDETQIPGTLTGVLQARLDRLQVDEMVTLQRASVVGRVFWDTAVKTLGDDQHQTQLRPLQTREFIYQQKETAFADTIQYLFKHDLLRDVTYQTVLKRARQLYHGQVAEWLAAAAKENGRSDEYASVIGMHYQAANKLGEAALWYGQAGKQAVTNFAHDDAIRYLTLALQYTPDNDYAVRFSLLKDREETYYLQGNRKAQLKDLNQLTIIAEYLGIVEQATSAFQWVRYMDIMGDYEQAAAYARVVIEHGLHINDEHIVMNGRHTLGFALYKQGKKSSAHKQFDTGLQIAENNGDKLQLGYFLTGMGLTMEGSYVLVRRYHEKALSIAREFKFYFGVGASTTYLGFIAMQQNDFTISKIYFEEALNTHQIIGNQYGIEYSLRNLGMIYTQQGLYTLANSYYEQSLIVNHKINNQLREGVALVVFGNNVLLQENYDFAKRIFNSSLVVSHRANDRISEGVGLNGLATIALMNGNLPLAITHYEQAITIHENLSQPYYLVETWAGLIKAMVEQGDNDEVWQYLKKILAYLKKNPSLRKTENPMRILHFTWEVLVALRQMVDANKVLTLAAQIMQEYLDKNSDPAGQEMYLNQPHHKVLWAAWLEQRVAD